MKSDNRRVTIIGAGVSGCFLAISFAKKGYNVEIYESRPDSRKTLTDGRSYNLTLYRRGEKALKRLGFWRELLPYTVSIKGNVCHTEKNGAVYSAYNKKIESLYTIHRQSLVNTLLAIVEQYPSISIRFDTCCIRVDKRKKEITFHHSPTNTYFTKKADLIVGCDGVNSVVRNEMQRGEMAEHHQEFIDWGYKEVTIPKKKAFFLREESLHTWPRKDVLFIGFPNADGSYTLMLNIPLKGNCSFEKFSNEKETLLFLKKLFPDLSPVHKEIASAIIHKPIGKFVTIYTTPWYYSDFIVLVGDSAHGVIPFYGQGMSSALEDCEILLRALTAHKRNREKAFALYESSRKMHTDALGRLSQENFIELKEKDASVFYVTQKKIETILSRFFPFLLPPLYIVVAQTTIPYADALRKYKKQKRILRLLGLDILTFFLSFPQFLQRRVAVMSK